MKKIYLTLFAFMLMANAPAAFAGEEGSTGPQVIKDDLPDSQSAEG